MITTAKLARLILMYRRRNPWGEFLGLGPDYGWGRVAMFHDTWDDYVFVLDHRSVTIRLVNLARQGFDTSAEEAALAAMYEDERQSGRIEYWNYRPSLV